MSEADAGAVIFCRILTAVVVVMLAVSLTTQIYSYRRGLFGRTNSDIVMIVVGAILEVALVLFFIFPREAVALLESTGMI